MATTTPNFGWDIPQSTDLVKDGATAIAALGTDIDTALVDLKGGTTGQVLSKNSNTDLDFTWVAQDDSNAIQNAIVDAKGDLISATAADTPARLAVGTNGQVLTADSTQSTGLAWTTISSGGMTLISETTASSLTSLSLSSIPSTYKDLYIIWHGVFPSNNSTAFSIRFNNDSTSTVYKGTVWQDSNSSTINSADISGANNNRCFIPLTGNTSGDLSLNSAGYLRIIDYASTNRFKLYYGAARGSSTNLGGYGFTTIGSYTSTSAITSIDIYRTTGTGSFSNATSSSIRLYGVS